MRSFFSEKRFNGLARKMQQGDEQAASALYDEFFGKVYGFCLNRVRHKPLAEDLTQEIFLKLVNKIGTFDPLRGTFSVWFWKLARNTLFDYYRRQKDISFSDMGEEEGGRLEIVATHNPEPAWAYKFETDRLDVFLRSLSVEDQELFRLRFVADLSYREIAGILEKPEGALRVSVSRLKTKIKKGFRNEI